MNEDITSMYMTEIGTPKGLSNQSMTRKKLSSKLKTAVDVLGKQVNWA